jgi:iron complex outermembrane receptor protein
MRKHRSTKPVRLISATAGSLLFSILMFQPALAEDQEAETTTAPQETATPEEILEEVSVTGFRQSLRESVALKREAVNSRDSIVNEDIGKMPDLNLAEAMQRIPGVAITREGGEGRQVTLRGLGPDFTQVTLNGMEVPSSAGGLDSFGGVNRGRAFDFNVFSAELFNRVDVNKTPTAAIEEGGIAGNVQLYTARPLDNPGFHASVYGQIGYNDLSEETDPRATAYFSTTNADNTIGFMATLAYTERTTHQDGFGTVRYGVPDRPFRTNNTGLPNAQVNSLWYPRLPRQDSFHHEQERLGLSAALQFRPSDELEFGLNWVNSEFEATTDSYNSFAQFRRGAPWGYDTMIVNAITIAADGKSVEAGDFGNVGLRTESRQNADTTDFNQYTADMRWGISDDLSVTGMIGRATSDFHDDYFRINIETPVGHNFSYDFTANPNVATLNYDFDVADPSNFFIMTNNETIQVFDVNRTNDTARLDFVWDLSVKHSFSFGAIYNDREVDSEQYACGTCVDQTDIAGLGKVYSYADVGGYGDATTLDFWVLDFDKTRAAWKPGGWVLSRGTGVQTWTVGEKTAGVYLDYNLFTDFAGHDFMFNIGARWVDTETTASAWLNASILNTEKNSYDNLLPSMNVAYNLTEDLVLRGALSRTMTRAPLSSLVPNKTYSDVNFSVAGGNSQLDPLESDNIDLAVEWYFAEQSVVSLAYFNKDIDSFISSPTTSEPLRLVDYPAVAAVYPGQPALLDPSLIWTYRTSANTEGTELDGFEVAYQQSFTDVLPGFWGNFGFIGNYSYVDATTEVIRNGVDVVVPLQGLSEHSWNATLYYEVETWGARLAVNNRDDYITSNTGQNGNIAEATTGPTRYDLSAFWHLSDMWTLTFEGINLSDEAERLYTTGDGTLNLVREYNFSGRQYFIGARVNF